MLPAVTRAVGLIATKVGPRVSSLSAAARTRLSSMVSAFKGGNFSKENVLRTIKENPIAAAIVGVELLGWTDDAVRALFASDTALEGQYRVIAGDSKMNGPIDESEIEALTRRDDDLLVVAEGANAAGGIERLQKISRALALGPSLIDFLANEKNQRGIRRTKFPPY